MAERRSLLALSICVLLIVGCGGGSTAPILPTALTLSEMVPIPGNPQGWTWDAQNDYVDDLSRGYLSTGGYMQIDPNAPDPWGWNQPISGVPNPDLETDADVANYVEIGRQPTTVTIYGAVWDLDNDYYVFYIPAGTTVSWVYSGALSVTSEIIAHPDLNPGGVVLYEGPNQYRVETGGFYFYKQERRGYSPADGNYDVPAGFPHFSCFRLDLLFSQD